MKQRIVTGVTAGALFLLFLALGGIWFTALILLLSLIGFAEYAKLNGFKWSSVSTWLGMLAVACLVVQGQPLGWLPETEAISWLVLLALLSLTVLSRNRLDLDRVSLYFLGVIYIGYGFRFMVATRLMDNGEGLFWSLLLFVTLWASDSGAYFSGKFFGKRPLLPSISPKKTVEGAVGGVVLAAAAAFCFSLYSPASLSYGHAVIFGIVVAVLGQLGDLIQSAYKRIRGVKDTGSILPGHGGVLDRCDSWLIVFPAAHFLSLLP